MFRQGSILYAPLDDDFNPVSLDRATFVKMIDERTGVIRFLHRPSSFTEAGTFDPAKHPRDRGGKFAPKGTAPEDVVQSVREKPSAVLDTSYGRVTVGSISRTPVFKGDPVEVPKSFVYGKQKTGAVAEALVVGFLRKNGYADARAIKPGGRSNYAIDGVFGNTVYDVKGGMINIQRGSQQWRLTIGGPSLREKENIARMTAEEKTEYHSGKAGRIIYRKNQATLEVASAMGKTVQTATFTAILNPKVGQADLFFFHGFHPRIGWKEEGVSKAYIGTVSYSLKAKRESVREVESSRPVLAALPPEAVAWWSLHTRLDLSTPYVYDAVLAFEQDLDREMHVYSKQIARVVRTL